MSHEKGLSTEKCLSLLNQLDKGCNDDGENNESKFPISTENDIFE